MKITIYKKVEVECKKICCSIGVRYWEDAKVNGVYDTENGDNIPCKEDDYWTIEIDVDTGTIVNWDNSKEVYTHYKSCDDNYIVCYDDNNNIIKKYEGYVPDFLSPQEEGYGDYVIMKIGKDGKIENWDIKALAEFLENKDE